MRNRQQQTQRNGVGGETQRDIDQSASEREQYRIHAQRDHRARYEAHQSITADRADPRQAPRNLLHHSVTYQIARKPRNAQELTILAPARLRLKSPSKET